MTACDVCKRMHEGRCDKRPAPCRWCKRIHPARCKPPLERTASITLSVPAGLLQRFRDRVPYGERSAFVAALLHKELG
jgi:hypothetical protein